ncbi:unnamed protein product [Lathyrus oleraceus]
MTVRLGWLNECKDSVNDWSLQALFLNVVPFNVGMGVSFLWQFCRFCLKTSVQSSCSFAMDSGGSRLWLVGI